MTMGIKRLRTVSLTSPGTRFRRPSSRINYFSNERFRWSFPLIKRRHDAVVVVASFDRWCNEILEFPRVGGEKRTPAAFPLKQAFSIVKFGN